MAAAVTFVDGEQIPAAASQTLAVTRQMAPVRHRHYPPGYRFLPTDEEIIYYLNLKIKNEPIPTDEIAEVNIYHYNPRALAEAYRRNDTYYFFTPRDRKYPNGKRPNRKAGDGYWKATGANKSIIDHENIVVGYKSSLVFYEGKPPKGEKTNWIMHEFTANQPPRNKRNPQDMRLDDWVLCRMYEKAPCNRNRVENDGDGNPADDQIVRVADQEHNNRTNVGADHELNSYHSFGSTSTCTGTTQMVDSFGSCSTGTTQFDDNSTCYLMTDEDWALHDTLQANLGYHHSVGDYSLMNFSSSDLQHTSFRFGDHQMNNTLARYDFGPPASANSDPFGPSTSATTDALIKSQDKKLF